MRPPGKNFSTALVLIGFLCFSSAAAGETVTRQELLYSIRTPVKKVALASLIRLVDQDGVVGSLALYDDPGTGRPVDYVELFDAADDLLAFGWFDRFGIARTAVDRGFLEAPQKPEGIFIIVVDGQQL